MGSRSNREKYNIRVVNISAGGDYEQSYLDDSLSQTVEECTAAGITIVCAVGNAGHLPNHPVFPPASAPSCIAVGGLDDNNSINRAKRGMYRSSYGPTVDGLAETRSDRTFDLDSGADPAEHADRSAGRALAETRQERGRGSPRHHPRKSRNRCRARRSARSSGSQHSTDNHSQASTRERDHTALQIRRRNIVLGADRLIARRADARGKPFTHSAENKTDPDLDRRTAAALRGRSTRLGRNRSKAGGRDGAPVLNL